MCFSRTLFSSKRMFEVVFFIYIKSTLSTMDTAGTVLKRCPSYRESDKESRGGDQLWVSVLQRSPSYRGVRYERVNCSPNSEWCIYKVKREVFYQGTGKATEKELTTNFIPTELCPLNVYHPEENKIKEECSCSLRRVTHLTFIISTLLGYYFVWILSHSKTHK